MTREEAIKELSCIADEMPSMECANWIEAISMAIKALEQEPCEDCISRQAAIDICLNIYFNGYKEKDLLCDIKKLPPVTPAGKVGRWELVQYDGNPNIGNWHCSECNRIVCGAITAVNPVYSYKYCPDCGAKMQEVEE